MRICGDEQYTDEICELGSVTLIMEPDEVESLAGYFAYLHDRIRNDPAESLSVPIHYRDWTASSCSMPEGDIVAIVIQGQDDE